MNYVTERLAYRCGIDFDTFVKCSMEGSDYATVGTGLGAGALAGGLAASDTGQLHIQDAFERAREGGRSMRARGQAHTLSDNLKGFKRLGVAENIAKNPGQARMAGVNNAVGGQLRRQGGRAANAFGNVMGTTKGRVGAGALAALLAGAGGAGLAHLVQD